MTSANITIQGGSSPHTRGALLVERFFGGILRIIPAYAGSTGASCVAEIGGRDHPRIRGEHTWESLQYQGSPP